jgi:hypothetical protein
MLLFLFAAVLAAPIPRPPLGITMSFGMYGALHSVALMVCSRSRHTGTAKLLFVVCAALLSASSAAMTLYGGRFMGWAPSTAAPVLLTMSSGLGALGYGWLVRRIWIADLSYGAIGAIAVLCVATSLLVLAAGPVPRASDGLWFAVPWWLAFSAGLGFCDRESIKIGNHSR